MINADADGRAAMYTTERHSEDMWRQRQSTVAADNSIDSRQGWQSTGVAVNGGGSQWWQQAGWTDSYLVGGLGEWRAMCPAWSYVPSGTDKKRAGNFPLQVGNIPQGVGKLD